LLNGCIKINSIIF